MSAAVARKETATDCEARGLATDGGTSNLAMAERGAAERVAIYFSHNGQSVLAPSRSQRRAELVVAHCDRYLDCKGCDGGIC
jgi:hypothetical protein